MLGDGTAGVGELFLQGSVSGLELQGCFEMSDGGCFVSFRQLKTGERDVRFGVGRIKANCSLEFRCSSWGFLLRVGFAEGAMDFADVWICLLQGLQLGDARCWCRRSRPGMRRRRTGGAELRLAFR